MHLTEGPPTINERLHVERYIRKHETIVHSFLDKFSKFAIHFYPPDINNQTVIKKLSEFPTIKDNVQKFVFNNEFNTDNVRKLLDHNNIYHPTKQQISELVLLLK